MNWDTGIKIMAKKWVSPLEVMIASENNNSPETINERTEKIIANKNSKVHALNTLISCNNIIEIEPDDCIKWQFKDRPENELGDIDDLSEDLKKNGQIHPVIIRKHKDHIKPYELIIGERRWIAAKKAGLKLKAILKENLSDHDAAIIQTSENDKRKDLSDYAVGTMLRQQIDAGIITAKDLELKLNKSQSHIRNLLSYSRLSQELISAIGDMRYISARTAYDLVRWQDKGVQYKNVLIELAPSLRNGKIGEKQLEKLIMKSINQDSRNKQCYEVLSKDGRHLFSWRGDTNKNKSISFPKSIREHVDFKELELIMIKNIDEQLKKRKDR